MARTQSFTPRGRRGGGCLAAERTSSPRCQRSNTDSPWRLRNWPARWYRRNRGDADAERNAMHSEQNSANPAAPLILVSADTHIGPRLKEDLRDYCPKQYLEEYDQFVKEYEPQMDPATIRKMFVPDDVEFEEISTPGEPFTPTNNTAGHYDVHARLSDMDRDGVAAEVIYHGSQNAQCFPFLTTDGGTFNAMVFSPVGSKHELELAAVGQQIYNRWLADQCSVEPERHAGLAHLPMWDISAAIAELERAGDAGLKGGNFPAPKLGIKPYDEPEWERFWATCAERGMALSTHAGADIDTVTRARPHTLIVLDIHEPQEKILP